MRRFGGSTSGPSAHLVLGAFASLASDPVFAHPHEWIDAQLDGTLDRQQRVVSVAHRWMLGEAFAAAALQSVDANGENKFSENELQELADENIRSLAEYDYFTFVDVDGSALPPPNPENAEIVVEDGRLTLSFVLSVDPPIPTEQPVRIAVYDPSYYLSVPFEDKTAVTLIGDEDECSVTVTPASGPSPEAAAIRGALGPDQRQLPPRFACGEAAGSIQSAADAVAAMAEGDLRALPADTAPPDAVAASKVGTAGIFGASQR